MDRAAGRTGYCRAGREVEVFRYGPHHGEEPPVSGTRGSGTVFFSRCTMRCLYCQNHPWSQEGQGRSGDAGWLARILAEVRAAGCHNWNLVSPTPWWPWILEALEAAVRNGARLPVVVNTSGFESLDTLRALEGVADVYLTDLRYARAGSAAEGSDAERYVDVARAALGEMWRQVGPLETEADGVARRGTICRVLVLPGRAEEAVESLRWLAETVGAGIAVSVMAQYTPLYQARSRPPWDRGVTPEEYGQVTDAVDGLGFGTGWVQEWGQPAPEGLLGCEMAPA